MRIRSLNELRAAALLAFLVFAACSSESGSDTPLETGGQRVSRMVDAKAGATLLLDDGASVHLPPGALAADAQVSFSREACDGVYASPRFQSCVYRVEAPEAVLNERITLSLAIRDESDAPTDCAAALTEDGWRCLVDTEVLDGRSEASASAFTDFTIRAEVDDIADQRCTDAPFVPCGGDLDGAWVLSRACGSLEEVVGVSFEFEDPYETCDPFEHYVEFPFSVDATLEFDSDGTMRAYETFGTTGHTMVTDACLAEVGETCAGDCTMSDGVCDCVLLSSVGGHGSDEPWAYGDNGTFIYFEQAYSYCVEGERLTVDFPSPTGTHVRVYERPPTCDEIEGCCISNDDCPEDWFCTGHHLGRTGTCER